MTTLTPREIFAQKQALTALPLNWFELDEWFPPLLFEGRQVVKKLKAADIDAYIRLRSVLRGAISPDVMRRNREIRCEAIVSLLRDEEARIVSGFATPPEITSTSGGSGRATGSSATRFSGIMDRRKEKSQIVWHVTRWKFLFQKQSDMRRGITSPHMSDQRIPTLHFIGKGLRRFPLLVFRPMIF